MDGIEADVGPCDFSAAASMAEVATVVQTALRAATGGLEAVTYDTDHFVFTSGTVTNQSNVSYITPYFPETDITDLSSVTYLNGRSEKGTITYARDYMTLTLQNMIDSAPAALYETNDGEKGAYVFLCDTNGENGAYAIVTDNATSTITISPCPATDPEAGWYWFLGGIVPTWMKWTDFGSPQHKQKVLGMAITTDPQPGTEGNRVFFHGMQDLISTVRTTKNQLIGEDNDTVNTINQSDKPATQHGFRIFRPSSKYKLKIEDITITHYPQV